MSIAETPVSPQEALGLRWLPAEVPGTAAGALRAAGLWAAGDALDFDARQVWYRCSFPGDGGAPGTRVLRFDGLATLCDVWVNGVHVLRSESMFQAHAIDVGAALRGQNELLLRFSPLAEELAKRRPRPRWKTGFARNQQARFFRTSLLGRVPHWPVPAPVGPWREVVLELRSGFSIERADLRLSLDNEDGLARLTLHLRPLEGVLPEVALLQVGDASAELRAIGPGVLHGEVRLPAVERWWPATHGKPALHAARAELGDAAIDLGRVGFRTVEVDREGGAFALRLNGVPIFCRGACWTPLDCDTLAGSEDHYRAALLRVRDGGMNMLRVAGDFVYEAPVFHRLCDELGIMVWQDLMFAALDYPGEVPAFLAAARAEAEQVCSGLQASPSLSVLCGGTDCLLQPALFGLPAEAGRSALFETVLAEVCQAASAGVPYVSNSPRGGDPASRVDRGVAHYFGVGAYRRPLEDARRSGVRFASECLAFSNLPETRFLESWLGSGMPVTDARWKPGVPRDVAAGWDYDDVRDHYFAQLHGLDPVRARSEDPWRYVALSEVLTGEVMEAVLSELRSGGSCRGALVWTWGDFRAGPGWGLVDVRGVPKAAYWMLRRTLLPVTILAVDEGLNGAAFHLANDTAEVFVGALEVALLRGERAIASGKLAVRAPARQVTRFTDFDVLRRFHDATFAFRFGPPQHDVVLCVLRDERGEVVSQAALFPAGRDRLLATEPGLEAVCAPEGADAFVITLRARRFAYAVSIELEAPCEPEDSFLHIAPGAPRTVRVRGFGARELRGQARPLNGASVRLAATR